MMIIRSVYLNGPAGIWTPDLRRVGAQRYEYPTSVWYECFSIFIPAFIPILISVQIYMKF